MRCESTIGIHLVGIILGSIAVCLPKAAIGDIPSAVEWLSAQQASDGSFVGPAEKVARFDATAETLRALHAQDATDAGDIDLSLASSYLINYPSDMTGYLSERLRLAALTNESPTPLKETLLARQIDGEGFPPLPDFDVSVLDTANVLLALEKDQPAQAEAAAAAISNIQANQNPDGGFSLGQANSSSVYVTGIVVEALARYRQAYPQVESSITDAHSFMEPSLEEAAHWGEDFVNAQALLALTSVSSETPTLYSNVIEGLRASQRQDGSWGGDVFTTALAVRALTAVKALGNGSETGAVLTGQFVFEGTEEPISGVSVSVAGVDGYSVTADAKGSFRLSGLANGGYTLVAERSGFVDRGIAVKVEEGQILDLGAIALAPVDGRGVLRFDVTDQATGSPLDGAAISLVGPEESDLSTGGNGQADSPGLPAGDYDFTVHASGYHAASGQVSVPDGSSKRVLIGMVDQDAPLVDGAAPLYGQVVDGETGNAVSDARVAMIDGGAGATTGSDGRFQLDDVERGTHSISLSAQGYAPSGVSVTFPAGAEGDLGQLPIFQNSETVAPQTLTLHLKVVDKVDGSPIEDVQVHVSELEIDAVTDIEGNVVLEELSSLSFSLEISATGYKSLSGTVSAPAWGEYFETIEMEPTGDPGADSLTVTGHVVDSNTGDPITDATISATSGQSTTSDESGSYELTGIKATNFELAFGAGGYHSKDIPVSVSDFGTYEIDAELVPYGDKQATVDRVKVPASPVEPDSVAMVTADVTNRESSQISVLVLGEIRDSEGTQIASFSPIEPSTGNVKTQFQLDSGETVSLTLPWSAHQTAPGTYTVAVRLVEPGSISRSNPRGTQIHEATSQISVLARAKFTGRLDLSPPLVQAGTDTPVELAALLRNIGNIELEPAEYRLQLFDTEDGAVLLTRTVSADVIPQSNVQPLSFGDWVPDSAGDFAVEVTSIDKPGSGKIEGSLYVGNMATGEFTVDPEEVPEGDQTVQGQIKLSGVDITTGTSTDPLFDLVKRAVTDGGEYVAPNAVQWHKRNRCLGCHIQTQSAFGLSSSLDKGEIDVETTKELVNYIASSQQNDGGLRMSHSGFTANQTALGLWALSAYPDQAALFGTELDALEHLYARRRLSEDETYWSADHNTGWLNRHEAMTALVTLSSARVLQTAEDLDANSGTRYEWAETYSLDHPSRLDLSDAVAYQGKLYAVGRHGVVVELDPETGGSRILPDSGGVSGFVHDIDVDDSGNLYFVGDFPTLVELPIGGGRELISLPSGYNYYGLAISGGGDIYLSREDSKLLKMTPGGVLTTVAAGGLLNWPRHLDFLPDGTLLIANHKGYNVLQWTPEDGLSVWTEGFAYRPIGLVAQSDGSAYVTTYTHRKSGQRTWEGLVKVHPSGIVERMLTKYRLFGAAVLDGDVYAPIYTQNEVRRVSEVNDWNILNQYRDEYPRIVKHILGHAYQDNNENLRNAFRLIALAEARPFVSDPGLLVQIDDALAHLEALLRNRQELNGGWSKYDSWNYSDPLITAWVGIALEYTNPSAEDEVVRNAISFLLNTQRSDGSWPNISGYFSTRLASTSLVMAYLPKALERLGGLDVQLDVDFPADIGASSFTVVPTSESVLPDGGASYGWDLDGVTASGQEIEFDLSLHDMELFEERAAARAASLTFKNSFTEEAITTPIEIPSIRAVSSILLDGSTDKQVYGANEPVQIAATVTNTGPEFAGGELHYTIVTAESRQVIAELTSRDVVAMSHGEQIDLPNEWNTGTHPAADYLVELRLYDSQDRLRARKDLPFAIEVTGTRVKSDIWTDQPAYEAWDEVQVTGRAINGTVNANLPRTLARIAVAAPDGSTLLEEDYAVRELAPGAYQDFPDEVILEDAAPGEYMARIRVFHSAGEDLLSESTATFTVERTELQAITGDVSASAPRVYQGDPITCNETVTNRSSGVAVNLDVVSELIFMDGEEIVSTETRRLELPAGGADSRGRKIVTDELEIGGYACRLLGRSEDGSEKLLDYDLFTVLEPPIEIDAAFSQPVGKGRVLILLDRQGRFLDDETCSGVRKFELARQFDSPVPNGSTIDARLLGPEGAVLDSESAGIYSDYVDQSTGQQDGNLVIIEFSDDRVRFAIQGEELSSGNYRLQATLESTEGAGVELDSGNIAPDCSLGEQLGAIFGDFKLAGVYGVPPLATDEPYGPMLAATLGSQRAWLEAVLDAAGWSYTIVESADAFARELRTGTYRAYALFSESTKLGNDLQKEIREAVYRGEGLLVAGPHDDRNHFVFEPLGVKQQGKHPDLDLVDVLESPLQDPTQIPLRLDEKPERIVVEGASIAARFEGVNGNGQTDAAETYFPFGHGVGIYGAFDLLVQGTEDGTDGAYADLLLDALSYAYPVNGPSVGHPVPASLTLTNEGIAVDGRVLFTLPSGIELLDSSAELQTVEGAPTWLFGLEEEAVTNVTLWLTAPRDSGDLAADIQVLDEGEYENYESLSTPLPVGSEVDTQTVKAALVELADQYKPLKHIVRDFEEGLAEYDAGNFAAALDAWLKVADGIQQHVDPDAGVEARLGLSRMIRRAEMRL